MDKRLEYIANHLEELKIGPDEPFRFHCTQCGKCCIEREDILLNPKDLFRMANYLDISPHEFVMRYCDLYIGVDSRMPLIRLRPQGHIRRCPMLQDRKCRVHEVKPTVCAMFPVGRGYAAIPGKDGKLEERKQIFILDQPDCGDQSETHTVREWFHPFGIPLDDPFYTKWSSAMMQLSGVLRELEGKCSKEQMSQIWTTVFGKLYLDYDMEEDFIQQFERNANAVLELAKVVQYVGI